MNKSEMKSVMDAIAKKLEVQKTFCCMAHSNKPAWRVLEELYNDGKRQYAYDGVHYNISYHPSQITHGNRSTTPEYNVTKYSKTEMFDADEVLAKKEIHVMDWMGGKDRIEKCGLKSDVIENADPNMVSTIVKIILNNTEYNVMVDRKDTGDVIIWIDDKRFTQR